MARLLLCVLAVLALASGQPLDLGFCSTACRQAAPQEACQNFVQQCQTAESVKNPTVQSLCETWAVTMKEGCGELISMAQGFQWNTWFIHADRHHHQGLAFCLPVHITCCDLSYRCTAVQVNLAVPCMLLTWKPACTALCAQSTLSCPSF